MKRPLVPVILIGSLAFAGCGSSDDGAGEQPKAAPETTAVETATAEPAAEKTSDQGNEDTEFLVTLESIDQTGSVYNPDDIPKNTKEEVEGILTYVGQETCKVVEKIPENERNWDTVGENLTAYGDEQGYTQDEIAAIFGAANQSYCKGIGDTIAE